jgi:hypothetical protein
MNRFCQGWGWPAVFALAVFVSSVAAQSATNRVFRSRSSSVPIAILPQSMAPVLPSPIDYFRSLLSMTPEQRESALANKPARIREKILAKVNEYAVLDSDERELRLRATELRWYLMPLLSVAPDDRATRLAQVPDDIRDLVNARLMQWELLPPQLQQEFLENASTLSYFSSMAATNNAAAEPVPSGADQSRWNALSEDQRQLMTAQFNEFFDLTPVEKQKALGGLSSPERAQMEKTIQAFGQLPPPQRLACIRAFGKFANMSPLERAKFLRNAERWSQMSPADRKAWVDLVAHVPPWSPPPPPAILMPSSLPSSRPNLHSLVVTNPT